MPLNLESFMAINQESNQEFWEFIDTAIVSRWMNRIQLNEKAIHK
jgi:hypothetical protein